MKENRKVPIKNILYMFSYIWDKAENIDFEYMNNNDDFKSIDILARLFLENIKDILNVGLYKEYKEHTDEIKGIKGKINFKESLDKLSFENAKAFCSYDLLEENNIINQIIKTTAYKLYMALDIGNNYKKELNKVLLYFNNVDIIEITTKSFEILFNRNNSYTYYMIMICKLINDSTMLSEESGNYKFINILDDDNKMKQVYELFIFKFYKYHLERISKKYKVYYQKLLEWRMIGENQKSIPEMRLDIMLENEQEIIIIDTKYYSELTVPSRYGDKKTWNSGNLYQMYAYMNNIETEKNLRGILLYPFNGTEVSEIYEIKVKGKNDIKEAKLQIQTIDLSKDWREIKRRLLLISEQ